MSAPWWQRARDWWEAHRWVGRLVTVTAMVALLGAGIAQNRLALERTEQALAHAERAVEEVRIERERATAFDASRALDICVRVNQALGASRDAWTYVLGDVLRDVPEAQQALAEVLERLRLEDCDTLTGN